MWTPGYSTSILQISMICEAFTSKVLIHFWKQEEVRRCQVRTVRRMLEDVPLELLTQQSLVSAGQYAHVHCRATEQSTRERAS